MRPPATGHSTTGGGSLDMGPTALPASDGTQALFGIYPPDDGSRASALVRQAQDEVDRNLYDVAQSTAAAAIVAARGLSAPRFEVWALCIQARANSAVGLRTEGLAAAEQALALAQACQDPAMVARAFNAAAYVALVSKDEEQAHTMLVRSLDYAREANSDFDLFWGLNNLAYIYGRRATKLADGDDTDAFKHALDTMVDLASQSQTTAGRMPDLRSKCYALLNLGRAHILSGDYDRAGPLIAQYAKIARQMCNPRLMAYANFDEAKLLSAQGKIPQAIACINTPENLEVLCNSDDLRLMTQEILAKLHKRQGTYKEALHHLEAARTLERQIHAFQSERQIALLTAKIEIEEARAEAHRLQSEATALELRNRLLEQDRAVQRHNALHDALTGLGNRRAADAAIARQLSQSARTGASFMLAYVDADHFKTINDRFGHPVGDKVLIRIGQLLQEGLRGRDEVYRFGGEEFVLLLVEDHLTTGHDICDRLRRRIKDHDWEAIQPGLTVTASFGLAVWSGETESSEVMSRADAALYRAKVQGRDRVIMH